MFYDLIIVIRHIDNIILNIELPHIFNICQLVYLTNMLLLYIY
jgi:hypothetical protein